MGRDAIGYESNQIVTSTKTFALLRVGVWNGIEVILGFGCIVQEHERRR